MTSVLTGRGVLLWFLAFFAAIFAANGYFIAAAVRTFSGEDEQRPYLQGVAYNQTLARRAEQQKLGWHATISAERLSSGKVRVAVKVIQPGGAVKSGLVLHGELRHPANENRDHMMTLKEAQPGLYRADVGEMKPGLWDVMVRSDAQAAPFIATRRLWVP